MEDKMPIKEAKEIIFGYACCAAGMCEVCPFIGDSPHSPCEGERLFDIKKAVETVARERKKQ